MILPDHEIKKAIEQEIIKVSPFPDFEKQLGPCSLDFRLGNAMKIFKSSPYPYLDLKRSVDFEDLMDEIIVEEGGAFILQPKSFALAVTKETFTLPDNIMARLDGRSSLGRLGVVVHSTAARFDPGWNGKAVMELGNLGPMPVVLYEGMRICALTFEKLSSSVEKPYGGKAEHKYTEQKSPHASRINKEFEKH